MAEKILITCDRVHSGRPCGEPGYTYTVVGPDESWDIDLCQKHAAPIYGVAAKEGRLSRHAGQRRTLSSAVRPWLAER